MVGVCRENTDQALSAHAAGKSRRYSTTSRHTASIRLVEIALILSRSLRNRPILLALLPAKPVEGKNHRCQPSDLLALLPGQNCLCHGQGWDVRSNQGPCHGLASRRQERYVNHEHMACHGDRVSCNPEPSNGSLGIAKASTPPAVL